MGKTISIRFNNDGTVKTVTPGAGPLAHAIAGALEQDNLRRAKRSKRPAKKRKKP